MRTRVLTLVATAIALGSAGAGAAAPPPLTAYLQRNAAVYTLWVTAYVSGLNSFQLILPSGNTYKLVGSPRCKLSGTSITCDEATRKASLFAMLKFSSRTPIPPSPAPHIFLTGESSNNSYEVKVPIKH